MGDCKCHGFFCTLVCDLKIDITITLGHVKRDDQWSAMAFWGTKIYLPSVPLFCMVRRIGCCSRDYFFVTKFKLNGVVFEFEFLNAFQSLKVEVVFPIFFFGYVCLQQGHQW